MVPAAPPPADPPGIFARATEGEPLDGVTFLLPGISYVAWQPVKVEDPLRTRSNGIGFEVSLTHWLRGGTYVGGAVQLDEVDRTRTAVAIEAGYQLVGLELGVAREFARDDVGGQPLHAQWSLQIAPYASLGMVFVSPRWVIALDRRAAHDGPGDGVLFVVGLKVPLAVGGR